MKTYTVEVEAHFWGTTTIEVQAKNVEEAQEKAERAALNSPVSRWYIGGMMDGTINAMPYNEEVKTP